MQRRSCRTDPANAGTNAGAGANATNASAGPRVLPHEVHHVHKPAAMRGLLLDQ